MITIDDFMARIAKPMFVFRMARGNTGRKSADTRLRNATVDIENLVLQYAEVIRQQREENDK